jgi:hypothetical protein
MVQWYLIFFTLIFSTLILFLFFSPVPVVRAMDWPTPDGTVTANFGLNDEGRPVLGTVFRAEGPVLAADKGELVFYRGQEDRASGLPSPLGAFIAMDHGDGILGIYSRFEDTSGNALPARGILQNSNTAAAGAGLGRGVPQEPPIQPRRGNPIAGSGSSGWAADNGFYFILFDRRERRWVNPSLIIAPFPDTTPPQIQLVQLQSPDGRIIPPAQARISQGRYSITVGAADTLSPGSPILLAPHRLVVSLNGAEVGALNFETYSARDGVLSIRRNGLVPAAKLYAPYPAFEVGEAWFTRGQTTLEVIARDVNGNERSFIRRLEVE